MNILLTRTERRWAHAALDTIFPGPDRGALPLGIESMEVDAFLDETLATLPFEGAIGLRAAFLVLALAPVVVLRRFATIASLSPADRLRVLQAVNASPIYMIRSLVMMVKAIASLFYCGDRRVRTSIVAVTPPIVLLRPRKGALSLPSLTPNVATVGADHDSHRRTA